MSTKTTNPVLKLVAAMLVALVAMTAVIGTSAADADAQGYQYEPYQSDDLVLQWINFAPQYNNYFTCVSYSGNHWVYTDFVDWNDPDESLTVYLYAYTAAGLRFIPMDVSGPGGHGVFFYKNISAFGGITGPAWVIAVDPHGANSGWVPVSC